MVGGNISFGAHVEIDSRARHQSSEKVSTEGAIRLEVALIQLAPDSRVSLGSLGCHGVKGCRGEIPQF